ncbi:uncharacterized protein Tco025E_02406 [Trypanosoma conorhini]|uniref:Uncharacterized protein n=1 Tax=Trypanosoma conorhini TaxID=83891 RepID=A0A3R7NP97_9TRYP|nr:uncharacterized protein Tco025E_02406 [Trypanosoma conorhini]RNF24929.1 hypothetical protein Tco025E_02406 [Trypanosoma conorhini]
MPLGAGSPPHGVRGASATTSIFSRGERGARSSPRYYDADLEWVPTAPLRQAMYRVYPFLLSVFLCMQACGQYLLWLLSIEESHFDDDASRRRRDQRGRRQLRGGQNGDSEEEEEADEKCLVPGAERGGAAAGGGAGARGAVELAVMDAHRGGGGGGGEQFCGPVKPRRIAPLRGFPLDELREEEWN